MFTSKSKVKRKCRQNNWKLTELHYDGYYDVKVQYGPTEGLIDYLIANDYSQMLSNIKHLESRKQQWPIVKTIFDPTATTTINTGPK